MRFLRNKKAPIGAIYAVGALFFVLSLLSGVLLGSTRVSLLDALSALLGGEYDSGAVILLYIRLPRTLGALVCGSALAVSGAVIQTVLANKLASPSIIGVNSGAGLAVTVAAALGSYGGFELSLFAFLGAFASTLAVSLGAKRFGSSRSTVILMGVAMNALLGAVSDTVITFNRELAVLGNDFKVGDMAAVTYEKLLPAGLIVIGAFAGLMLLSSELDVLSLGEESARGLGLNTSLMRMIFLMLSALLASAAVSLAGLVSFVGLLVPHAVRGLAGGESRHLIPLCALFGGGFVAACDTLARVILAPYELPVGIIMAFLGAPFFLFMIIKGKGGQKA